MLSKGVFPRATLRGAVAFLLAVTLSVLFIPLSFAYEDVEPEEGATLPAAVITSGSNGQVADFSLAEDPDTPGNPLAPSDLGKDPGESEDQSEDQDPDSEVADGKGDTESDLEDDRLSEGDAEVADGAGGEDETGTGEIVARLAAYPPAGTHRLAGKDRYATAALVSAQAYPDGADVVILATGASFPDAISVAPLASKLGAPVLLTQRSVLPQPTQRELERLEPDQVIVVGGVGAISEKVAKAAAKDATTLTRLGGSSRYETSLAISQFGWKEGAASAFIATGSNFADALTAGPAAGKTNAPILLVPKNTGRKTAAVKAELQRLGVQRVHVAGGTGAVSAAVLKSVAHGITTTRYAGADRYQTSEIILKAHFSAPVEAVYWASGEGFPDAVPAAGVAGALGVPLAISRPSCVPLTVNTTVKNLQPKSQVVLGGPKVLSENVLSNQSCFAKAPTPTISGKASVGSTLTGKPGTWSPTPSSQSYQWLRSGKAISGATNLTYKLVKADAGNTVTFRVTAKADGFATTSRTSAKTAVVVDPASIDDASSINVVVNKKRPLNPKTYVPANLRLPVGIGNSNGQPLRAEAATALEKMHAAGKKAGYNYYLMSGYRSYSYQANLYNSYLAKNGQTWTDLYSARAGHSEHQTGLAADIYEYASCTGSCFGGSSAGIWLRDNAYKYGFILRYGQGMQHIVGYAYEPWHFRYVGTTVATDMHDRGIRTLEQYYGLPAAPNY